MEVSEAQRYRRRIGWGSRDEVVCVHSEKERVGMKAQADGVRSRWEPAARHRDYGEGLNQSD
jgi:hypothetical protein